MDLDYLHIGGKFAEVRKLHRRDAVEAHQSLLLFYRETVHLFCRIQRFVVASFFRGDGSSLTSTLVMDGSSHSVSS